VQNSLTSEINLSSQIEQLAISVERLGLSLPAFILLETCKPLRRLAIHIFDLLPGAFGSAEHPFMQLVKDQRQIDALLARLEVSIRGGARS